MSKKRKSIYTKDKCVGLTARIDSGLHEVARDYCHEKRVSLNKLLSHGLLLAMAQNWPK